MVDKYLPTYFKILFYFVIGLRLIAISADGKLDAVYVEARLPEELYYAIGL